MKLLVFAHCLRHLGVLADKKARIIHYCAQLNGPGGYKSNMKIFLV